MTTATVDAPARIVIQALSSVPPIPINHSEGHEHDQGTVQRVVSKAVNGSTDILATVFSMTPHQYHPLHAHPELGELYLGGRL